MTGANGAVTTETGTSGSGGGSGNGGGGGGTTNKAAIIAPSVIAAILLIVVCYLAFCAWLYRKRLNIYKRHLDMAHAGPGGMHEKPSHAGAALLGSSAGGSSNSNKPSHERRRFEVGGGLPSSSAGESGGERHGSNTGSGNGYSSVRRSSDASQGDLMQGNEPTFWGTMLAPRRSLRVINRD